MNLFFLLLIVLCGIITAIMMFMARIEFFTMALITLPLLPFMMTGKFSFLADKAIGAMFNLAIKVMCISFISAMVIPLMDSFTQKLTAANTASWEALGVLFQAGLMWMIVLLITIKVPALITGLLAGQPAFGGMEMKDMAVGAATKASGAGGAVHGAVKAAKADGASGFRGVAGGTLRNLAKGYARNTSMGKAYIDTRKIYRGQGNENNHADSAANSEGPKMNPRVDPMVKNGDVIKDKVANGPK